MKKLRLISLVLCFLAFAVVSKAQNPRLNQTQVIGSHNSYKSAMPAPILEYLQKINPAAAKSLEYEHLPLSEQLDLGLRNLELDVFHDPMGGKYTNPKSLAMLPEGTIFDSKKELQEPGLKLFHVQDLDVQSHHLLFKNALLELRDWSNKNPDHHPVFVLINAKDGLVPMTVSPLSFSGMALDSIDLEVRTYLGMDKLITPDQVRGAYESVEKAVLAGNWPEMDAARGKFLFVLDESEEKIRRYLTQKPGLKNAVLFVNLKEGNPEAGFRIINDPISNETYIQELVTKGYIIRTRADSDTKEARTGDYTKFEKAKASGAQVISTDYYMPSRLFPSDYSVSFENKTFERTNPILIQK
ncbi:phosphatidylinositol-specific phospholipase C1-like protein [Cognataquiflexum rubidum]|uniref:phosphatidylinositol-specific phospholipase C1-like protein n=1 Tax=Cognataquiflexum rubidum TaxID=2922273 RepID=UPI001F136965|nr:phosphatidylinositol-specific phospholipase C1-like protein [Cognataquiflexum rubidum]MCH6234493.1 phosphatidylinositol-specific phospholipase C1-like protein [Cognataquiflexum rubidum]